MNKKITLGATIALIIISVALTVSVTMVVAMRNFNYTMNKVSQRQAMFDYIADVDKEVRTNYLGGIDEGALRASLAKGYVIGIDDPYASYLSAEEYRRETERLSGRWTGLGLETVRLENNSVVISVVHKNSAADRAGIQKGDVITLLDGNDIETLEYSQVNYKLSKMQKLELSVTRGKTSIAFEISESPYTITSVESRMIGSTGYIVINSFYDNTPQQFRDAYKSLEEKGAENYIFDLRYNKGGHLKAVGEALNYLIPRGSYAHRVTTESTQDLMSTGSHEIAKPSVTLVNSQTEGEAELFAGALKESKKTTIVGVNTAGRGMVQQYYTLKADGAAIKISVAYLSLASGATLEGKGIAPDVKAEMPAELKNRFRFLTHENDPQLIAAIATLRGGTIPTSSSGTTTGITTSSGTTSATTVTGTTTAK
ncbi:MAG: S41 family peptidase [Oscillospiraceae bacterium]|nr:S41 family peptidase [Oscillospiraceae bacterium]MDD3832469.1 S41 family peptidase [Oscillospiraceae bacterium]MDD4546423.1 S41 family peptidase [Oscillospiraceae bacterium]